MPGAAECPDLLSVIVANGNYAADDPLRKVMFSLVYSDSAVSDLNAFQAETTDFMLEFHRITSSVVWDYALLAICFIVCKMVDVWGQCWLQEK